MRLPQWDSQFATSSAGRILTAIREGETTIEELAQATGLSEGAVRLHVATLQRDGLVVRGASRSGVSKPAYTYRVAPDAEWLFSRAYIPVLAELLRVLAAQLDARAFDEMMRRVGRGLMGSHRRPTGSRRQRVEAACQLFNELGALTSLELERDRYVIRSAICPLSVVAASHPEVCSAVESLLSEFIGSPVAKCCKTNGHLGCCFTVDEPAESGSDRAASGAG